MSTVEAMTVYRVGERMPGEWRCPGEDRTEWNYRSEIHLIVMTYYDLALDKVLDFRRGAARFAFTVEENVIFLLYTLGRTPWSDNPYSWHQLPSEEQEAGLPPEISDQEQRALVRIVVVEGRTRQVVAHREVFLTNEMTRELHAAIRRQAQRGWEGETTHEETIRKVYREYPTPGRLLKRAQVSCTGTDQAEES